MKAIEAYYRIMGALMVDRYVPIRYEDEFLTAHIEGEGFEVEVENYGIIYGYSYNQRDADDYDTETGDAEVYVNCRVEFDGDVIGISTFGVSDNYEGDMLDEFKVCIDEDAKELFKTIEHAFDKAIGFLEDYESEYHAEHDFDIDEDAEYENWRDQRD